MKNLEEARQRLRLTQSEMAIRLNVSLKTIEHWEQSQRSINSSKLIRIAKSYEMTNYELLQYLNLIDIKVM